MADPGLRMHWHADDLRAYATNTSGDNLIAGQDEQVTYSYNTRNKQSFLRLRFRAETSFRNSHNDIGKLVNTIDPSTVPVLYPRKSAHLPPFYYVFLFRLTPF